MSQALLSLEKQFQRIAKIDHAATFLSWDQMVMMPNAGVNDELNSGAINPSLTAHVSEMQKTWQQAVVLPAELVHAQVLAGSQCEHGWRTQKTDNDWAGFLVNFKEVVALAREEAQCRQSQNPEQFATSYDAMLDLHCAGDSQALIAGVFSTLKQELPQLLGEVMEKQAGRFAADGNSGNAFDVGAPGEKNARKGKTESDVPADYPIEQQQALSEALMQQLGFDFDAGRLDVSMHPFSTGVRGDQRITTRYRTTDFADALQATAHETGHASYESGLPEKWQFYPVGNARNMCIHESQSLYYEKHLFLSRAFGRHFVDCVHQHLPASVRFTANDLWFAQTRVQPSLIRVEADEVTYPLHVMLRYDIESALINNQLQPEQVPEVWESLLEDYLGLSTDGNHALGCLQDIHWTDGSFGYFPSYTMGAVNAAQISASIKTQMPDWADRLGQGDVSFAREWLAENIWHKASSTSSQELMKSATGETTQAEFLLQHLRQRYLQELD